MRISAVVFTAALYASAQETVSIAFDPCMMWEQMPVSAKIAGLGVMICFAAVLISAIRRHLAPARVGMAGLLFTGTALWHEGRRLTECYTAQDQLLTVAIVMVLSTPLWNLFRSGR